MQRVVVSGLGRAGSGYDAASGLAPRTHVGAIHATSGLTLVAAVDVLESARDAAAKQWNWNDDVRLAASMDSLPRGCADLVVICSPSDARLSSVRDALALGARFLLIEKPLADSVVEAALIAEAVQSAGAEARVVFHRRFDPGFQAVRAQLPSELPKYVIMRFGKGLRNYGSHLLDLLLDWFGPVASVQAFGPSHGGSDPTVSFRCRMKSGFDAIVLGLSDLQYDQFDIDLYYSDRRIELRNGGCEKLIHRPVEGLYYPGYSHLGTPEQLVPSGPVLGLSELYANVRGHLEHGYPVEGATLHDALHGLAVIETALASAAQGGKDLPVELDLSAVGNNLHSRS